MAVAPMTLESLRTAGLADVDPEIASLLVELGYEDVVATQDIAGRDRVVEGTRA